MEIDFICFIRVKIFNLSNCLWKKNQLKETFCEELSETIQILYQNMREKRRFGFDNPFKENSDRIN